MRILGSFQASCIELCVLRLSGFEQTRLYQSNSICSNRSMAAICAPPENTPR